MSAAAPTPPPTSTHDVRAALPRLDRHRPKGPPMRASTVGRKRALVLLGVYVLMGLHVWHWLATGKSVTPIEPSEAMQTFEIGRINAGFLFFAGAILLTLLFGRWICGWACHLVALQDLAAWVLAKFGLYPRPIRSRLLVLGPWVVAGHMFAWPFVQKWFDGRALPDPSTWEWQLQTEHLWQTFPGPIMSVLSVLFCTVLIVWWLGAKGFCTHGCPYGAFFAIADRFSPTRIKVSDACNHCGHCTHACSSNVRVHEEVAKHKQIVDPGCMKCLDCVSVCPTDALSIGFALPKPFVLSQQRIQARADFSWPEEILLAVVAFGATQFVWRGAWFGEAIPFLLSVALGVITAVFALLAVRLVVRRDLTFQHTLLKQGGKLTRAGRWGLLGVAAWLLLSVHTAAGQWRRESLFAAMKALKGDAAAAAVEALVARADSALAWDVLDDPFVHEMRGMLLWRLGKPEEGSAELLRAFETRGHLDMMVASLNLAMSCLPPRGMRLDVAETVVKQVLALQPEQPMARDMLQAIESLKQQKR